MPSAPLDEPHFCADEMLAYERLRTRFGPGEPLLLDEAYRLAHLPLIAPDHPGVIPTREGAYYERGRHPRVHSLVLPIPWGSLSASPDFRKLDAAVRAAPFAPKAAWEIMPRRQEHLHATLCGSLAVGSEAYTLLQDQRRELARLEPFTVDLRGLFSGNINRGRLYLRAYPECRRGENVIHVIQDILGRPRTDLYVVGLYHLKSDLDASEAKALAQLVDRWWSRSILRLRVSCLWVLWAMDDLVLDAGVAEAISLSGERYAEGRPAQRIVPAIKGAIA